jgi:hypothetical protein
MASCSRPSHGRLCPDRLNTKTESPTKQESNNGLIEESEDAETQEENRQPENRHQQERHGELNSIVAERLVDTEGLLLHTREEGESDPA